MVEYERVKNKESNNECIDNIVQVLKKVNNPKRLRFYYKLIIRMEKEVV